MIQAVKSENVLYQQKTADKFNCSGRLVNSTANWLEV